MKKKIGWATYVASVFVILLVIAQAVGKADTITGPVTYVASVGGQATTANIVLSIEPSATVGFKLIKYCVGMSNATTAAPVTVTVQRRTTAASSGGTALTNEGTGATAISKHDWSDANYPGIARLNGTPGTAGAVLDQEGFTVGEIAAGAADPASLPVFCQPFNEFGLMKPIRIQAGVTNGVSITVTAPGAGGLASGSITAWVVTEN